MFRALLGMLAGPLLLLGLACTSSGAGGREVLIIQTDEGCIPETVAVTPGEKLKLTGKNETGKIYELEGTNGTELEEVIIPEGRTRSVGYTVPNEEEGTYDVKCYQPGGASTIVKLVAGAGSGNAGDPGDSGEIKTVGGNDDPADAVVEVALTEYAIDPSKAAVAEGNIEFVAANRSADEVHELAVLKIKEDGAFDVVGEVEDIPAGADGAVRLRLDTGDYELACLIVPGEAGSTVDHYAQGMRSAFSVE